LVLGNARDFFLKSQKFYVSGLRYQK
jgi:hypothetical protein